MLIYASLKSSFLFNGLGGKITLATTGNDKFAALLPGLPAIVIAGFLAIIFMAIAWKLPDNEKT
jgi:hypothetical protein